MIILVNIQNTFLPVASLPVIEEAITWTDDDILDLRLELILHALNTIRDLRKLKQLRSESWCWLFDDEDSSPFSSVACAQCTGYDIVKIRQTLLKFVPHL